MAAALVAGLPTAAQHPSAAEIRPFAPPSADPAIAGAIGRISADNVRADIAKLVSFGTRSTLSSTVTDLPAVNGQPQGVLPAAAWIEAEFGRIGAACGGCLEIKRDEFIEQPAADGKPRNRYAQPTPLVNVYAILRGADRTAPWVLVTGHMDSRVNDVMDARAAAPGANDDASGVAVSIEAARVLSQQKFAGTIVFVAVDGEEQGLNGSAHLAKLAKAEGWPLEAVLNNDIVGGDTTPGAPASGPEAQNNAAVRVFSESVPSAATPEQARATLGLGAESDSPSRELARSIVALAPVYFPATTERAPRGPGGRHAMWMRKVPAFTAVPVLRRDRYLRGGDHTSFNAEGFAAVRFSEWRENFDHQHNAVRVENGTQYGDLLRFVDMNYVARVAALNAAMLASLASAPGEPQAVRVVTSALDNNTELTWQAPVFAPAGTHYLVVWRPTDQFAWQSMADAGTATRLKLPVSKDNVLFGVMAVDAAGHRSLPVPPVPAR